MKGGRVPLYCVFVRPLGGSGGRVRELGGGNLDDSDPHLYTYMMCIVTITILSVRIFIFKS